MTAIEASVVVSTNPHEGDLVALLAAYAGQVGAERAFEIIVVDNGSRPETAAACRAQQSTTPALPLRRIASNRPGRAAANNAGARAACGQLLVFMADDFIPSPGLVRAHLDFHRACADPSVGVGPAWFTPRCRDDPFRRWLEDSGALFGVPFRMAGLRWPRDFFYAGNASLPRALFERVGCFDEVFEHDTFDDLEFGVRLRAAGVPTHLLRKAVAWHDHAVTLDERAQAMRQSGAAAALLDRKRAGLHGADALAGLARRGAMPPAQDVEAGAARPATYRAALDRAFVEGYRAALAQAPAQLHVPAPIASRGSQGHVDSGPARSS